jgi:H/ACA ribonucleoprotein complex subunit 4
VETGSVILHDAAYWFMMWQEKKDETYIKRFIQPMERALDMIPKVHVRDSAVDALCHGANLTAPGVLSFDSSVKAGSMIAVLTLKNEAVCLSRAVVDGSQVLNMEHGVVAKTDRVLMPRGTYPKGWKSGSKKDE